MRRWLDTDYPAIVARAKAEGAEIRWGDETGLRSDDVRGRGYAPKGETPVVRVSNKREGLSIISTVTNQGTVRWRVFSGAMNTAILIDFLKRLIKGRRHKIFLIVDNLKVHHARKVKEWLAAHRDAIEVFYLPSYSPASGPGRVRRSHPLRRVRRASRAADRDRAHAPSPRGWPVPGAGGFRTLLLIQSTNTVPATGTVSAWGPSPVPAR